jgi:hypothetical protein
MSRENIVMTADIVISANFSDAGCRILAGDSEDTLRETPLLVSDVRSLPLNAVKALAKQCNTAMVLSRIQDNKKGWCCERKMYRRLKAKP